MVQKLQDDGKTVLYVGDGDNDSDALAVADIGIGCGIKGTEQYKSASDMIFMGNDFP